MAAIGNDALSKEEAALIGPEMPSEVLARFGSGEMAPVIPIGREAEARAALAWISEGANKSWCSPTGARPVRVRP